MPLYSTTKDQPPLLINAGSTSFSFEIPLPSGIPESIQSPQINVDYQITAQMNLKRNNNSLYKELKKQLILARLPDSGMLAGENCSIIIDSHKHFSNWCQYRISIDSKSATIGSTLPVKFEIAPTTKDFKLKQILVQILEKRILDEKKYQSIHFLSPTTKQSPTISTAISTPWEASFAYQIPTNISHSTDNYKYFSIEHILLISLIVSTTDPNDNKKSVNRTISFQTRIDLLDSNIANLMDPELPPYNCPISQEEIQKLNRHGLVHSNCIMEHPPTYDDAPVYTLLC